MFMLQQSQYQPQIIHYSHNLPQSRAAKRVKPTVATGLLPRWSQAAKSKGSDTANIGSSPEASGVGGLDDEDAYAVNPSERFLQKEHKRENTVSRTTKYAEINC